MFTGHSLGAAVSTIAAVEYSKQRPGKVDNVTFGSPLVGNHLFKEEFKKQRIELARRYVNGRDPVPKSP